MLLVLFKIEDITFGLDTEHVVEVVPFVELKPIVGAIEAVRGYLDYRGTLVPVLDMGIITAQKPSKALLSTRIALVDYRPRTHKEQIIGLLAEEMTDILEVNEKELRDTGIAHSKLPHLGKIAETKERTVHCVELDKLITEELENELFSELARDGKEGNA